MQSDNTRSPFLGQEQPVYPALDEMIRVTGPAVATNVYPGQLQQYVSPLTARDRVPVYLWEPNGVPLQPAIYEGHLAGSYAGLPLYVTDCCPG